MSEENVEIVRRVWDAVGRRDTDAVFALYDADIVRENHTGGALELQDVSYRGHTAVRQFWREWLEPFATFEAQPETFIDAGSKVVVPWRATARGLCESSPDRREPAGLLQVRDTGTAVWA
jgi:ketosteroid isomerase-like protein